MESHLLSIQSVFRVYRIMLVHSFLFLAYVKMSYGAICNQKYLEFSENYDIGITPERRHLKN